MSAAEIWLKGMRLARNMSAPPRTTLTFSALATTAASADDAMDGGTGLHFFCRLNPRAHLPVARQMTGARARAQDAAHIHERIRAAVLYGRAEASGCTEVTQELTDQIMTPAIEGLADELQAMLVGVPLPPEEFPAIGLLLPIKEETPRPILPGLVRTLAVLGRRRGSIFVRDADPIVWTALRGDPLDLWLPGSARTRMREVVA